MSTGDQAVELVRQQYHSAHTVWLEGTGEGLTSHQARWRPAGQALPAGAHYLWPAERRWCGNAPGLLRPAGCPILPVARCDGR